MVSTVRLVAIHSPTGSHRASRGDRHAQRFARRQRQKPNPTSAIAAAMTHGRYGASLAAATAPPTPSTAMTTGPGQQSVPKIPTSAPATGLNGPTSTAALALWFMG